MPAPSPYTIRAAGLNDVPVLARLRYEFRATLDPAAEPEPDFLKRCQEWMSARLATPGSWRCWVAQEAGTLAGTVWLLPVEKLPNPVGEPERHGYVSSLYVRPAYRGGGLGSELLATCLGACEAEGFDALFLWPTPRSRTLYLRHGFEVRQDLLERRLVPIPSHGGAV
jgi:GNAT superfamily N-acetyltransferase